MICDIHSRHCNFALGSSKLPAFRRGIQIILQTVLPQEYEAALDLMKPPTMRFDKPVKFDENTVIGMFAEHKTALIRTEAATNAYHRLHEALKNFPKVKYIISAGVCYAFDEEKCKINDVIVSKEVIPFTFLEYNENGQIVPKEKPIAIPQTLQEIFCQNCPANVHCGPFLSLPAIVKNEEMCKKFYDAGSGAIGGEKEGSELLRLQETKRITGFILIKAVVDYGKKGYDEHSTSYVNASSVAIKYAERKLLENREFLGIPEVNS